MASSASSPIKASLSAIIDPISFPKFSHLPLELQQRIWHLSFPPPRIVDVYAIPIHSQLQLQEDPSTTSCTSDESKWRRTYIERLYAHPQPLMQVLHACHLSRRLAFQRYAQIAAERYSQSEMYRDIVFLPPVVQNENLEIVFARSGIRGVNGQAPFVTKPYALMDPKRDILFLQDPNEINITTGSYITSSIDILLRWLRPSIASHLRRLAVTYYTWHKTKNRNGSLEILRGFGALEVVFVSWLGKAPVRTWSDVVVGGHGGIGGGGHIEEIRDELRCDVEVLRRLKGSWKVPIVEVIMDPGILVAKLED